MNPAIGLQLWSVRNSLQVDYVGTLEKIAAIGYKNLELITTITPDGLIFGKDMTAAALRYNLDRCGLKAVSCHIVPDADTNWERLIADCHTLGVGALVCAIAFFEDRLEVLDFCNTFNQSAELCHKNGLRYYYHNHFHEFQIFEGQTIFDTLIENLDKELVPFELDTYWAARGGAAPVDLLRKLGKRCDMLHQKDIPAGAQPINWFDRFGSDKKLGLQELIETQDNTQFTEVGEGILDIPAFIKAGRTYSDVKYIFVEQDLTSMTELESIAVSFKNLTRLIASA
jgi:sugar phosphate isomerase/epimerase